LQTALYSLTEEEEAVNEDLYGAVNTKNIDQIPVFDLNPQVDKGEQSMEVVANSKGQSSSHLKSASNWDQGWNYLQIDVNAVSGQIILTPVTREYIRSLRWKV